MVYGRGWRHAPFREYIDPENPSLIAALPPCFLVTARGDFLRHYSRDFAAALKKNGREAELLDMDEPEKLAHAFAAMLPETSAARQRRHGGFSQGAYITHTQERPPPANAGGGLSVSKKYFCHALKRDPLRWALV